MYNYFLSAVICHLCTIIVLIRGAPIIAINFTAKQFDIDTIYREDGKSWQGSKFTASTIQRK